MLQFDEMRVELIKEQRREIVCGSLDECGTRVPCC